MVFYGGKCGGGNGSWDEWDEFTLGLGLGLGLVVVRNGVDPILHDHVGRASLSANSVVLKNGVDDYSVPDSIGVGGFGSEGVGGVLSVQLRRRLNLFI